MAPAENATRAAGSRAALDGAGLEKALAQGSLDQPATQLIGMMKACAKPGHVSFAPAGRGSWVDIPSGMITEAQHIGHQPCEAHSHPVFRILLNEPTDPQAKALLQLMAARTLATMSMPAGLNDFGGEGLPAGPSVKGWAYLVSPCGSCPTDPWFAAFA